jgi:hypothetical protein
MVRLDSISSLSAPLALALAFAFAFALGCTPKPNEPQTARDGSPDGAVTLEAAREVADPLEASAPPEPKSAAPSVPSQIAPPPVADLASYLRSKLPTGGSVEGDPPRLTHTVQAGETAAKIAAAYLELTEHYKADELASEITRNNRRLTPETTITIPRPLTRVPRSPREDRLGWPEDKILRGVFVTGTYANIKWSDTVDKVSEHGLNAIVLDAKDYDGYVNYPSKAKIAIESGAIRAGFIPDLARAIRYAHWHGVRVILRIPCFHDPWTDKHLPGARLSIRFAQTNKPIHIDWLDPTLTEAQDYVIDLAREGIEAGADEIQLDYVRFPVHITGKVAVLPPPEERPKIIRDFVKRVRAVTQEAGIHLSLDFFGVTATGIQDDIDKLGQDIPTVAPEADAISLMAYPSHYGKGYRGFENPADHPEIVGIGNKMALEKLRPTGATTIFRTWLQAFPLGVTHYDSRYLRAQAEAAESSGGHGWLMWSPGCEYSHVWNGWPKVNKPANSAP